MSQDTIVNKSQKGDNQLILNENILHIEQLKSNDCGVACLKMVLNYVYNHESPIDFKLNQILIDLKIENKSLWTIDIAHVLSILNVKHKMCTINFGVLECYSEEEFYIQENDFENEKLRINQKFQQHKQLGINIFKNSINLDQIKEELRKRCACVILIDANKLNGINTSNDIDLNLISMTKNNCCTLSSFTSLLFNTNNSNYEANQKEMEEKNDLAYCGHFIVVIGYDDMKKIIFYRNPSTSKCLSYTSEYNFELARKSFGTDEDILFVYPE